MDAAKCGIAKPSLLADIPHIAQEAADMGKRDRRNPQGWR
jgi:hypothetical protein